MKVSRRSSVRAVAVIALALAGAAVMIYLDSGGTTWLKFALYVIFFYGIFLAAVSSSVNSCGGRLFRRQPRLKCGSL
jgi:hypothetical protein